MQKFYLEAVNRGELKLSLYQVPTSVKASKGAVRGDRVATISGWRLRVAHIAIVKCMKAAGYNRSLLRIAKSKKTLNEEDGIRLGLTFKGLKDLKDAFKAHELVSGVYQMSREESYYWYAKISNGSPGRGLRALRVLLAGVE
jgi:hypothetical protein